jgi:hypothetical protein
MAIKQLGVTADVATLLSSCVGGNLDKRAAP